jgi:hypothetical protein
VHVTVVVPTGNSEPDAGLQLTVGLGSLLSVAVAENVTTAPAELVAGVVMSLGTVSVGAVVSAGGGGAAKVTVTVTLALFCGVALSVHEIVVCPTGK